MTDVNALLVAVACALALGLVPVIEVCDAIVRRAHAAKVRPWRYVRAAWAGWGVGSIVLPLTLPVLNDLTGDRIPESWDFWIVLVSSFVGGVVGACPSYVVLRMRTARHPDYEDLTGPEKGSLEADIPQPRDRDHIGPD
jgi:hypothetical protein